MDLAVHPEHAVRCYPRYHKYTLGTELRRSTQRLCQQMARANNLGGLSRATAFDELVPTVEEMKTLLTLAQETRAFTHFNEFATATQRTVGLGKRSGGWRRRVRSDAAIQV